MAITVQEEKEVHRVFELLCDYAQRTKLKEEIKDLQNWIIIQKNKSFLNEHDEQIYQSQLRIDELQRELHLLDMKTDKKMNCNDIMEILKKLQYKMNRKQVEEMIWEVDENLDGCLDWNEFRLMFNRNITDRTGLEPCGMFNLTQFLIYDTNYNGLVSVDETMNLLYARYGRSVMEQKLKELFGENMQEFGRQGGEINFQTYLTSVEKVQLHMFLETNRGKRAKDLQQQSQSQTSHHK